MIALTACRMPLCLCCFAALWTVALDVHTCLDLGLPLKAALWAFPMRFVITLTCVVSWRQLICLD